jgi:tetratricopeptide (TPR) repeat protein
MRVMIIILSILLSYVLSAGAVMDAESLQQAKDLASSEGKPILLEFMREDCKHCAKARREAHEVPEVSQALDRAVHYMINVLESEGGELKQRYDIGDTYPVFVLTDSEGDVISRWTGYSGSADFIRRFSSAMNDLTTMRQRIEAFEASPSYSKAIFLARYFTDTGDHPQAVKYFREAQKLNPASSGRHRFDIFMNSANAVWKEQRDFAYVYPPADSIMLAEQINLREVLRVASLISRLTRKFDRTDSLAKYIDLALKLSAGQTDARTVESRTLLLAEKALQLEGDTARALSLKKSTLGSNWGRNPKVMYEYAKWCLKRKVNLREAEEITQKVVDFTPEGELRARVYSVLADILVEQGRLKEAAQTVVTAIENHPENPFYVEKLEELQAELDQQK